MTIQRTFALTFLVAIVPVGRVGAIPPQDGVPQGHILIEGDIIVPEGFLEARGTYATNLWPGGIVPYEFDANVSTNNQALMLAAMGDWEATAQVDFRLRVAESQYVHIRDSSGDQSPSNSSSVGMQPSGQTINIVSWGSNFTIVHELGHALGLWHEQSRTDRNQFIQVNYQNICQTCCNGGPCDYNFDIRPSPGGEFGTYDFDSVMHYGQFDFSRNGLPTITVLPPNEGWQDLIGQRDHLSAGDVGTMQHLYGGCSLPPPPASVVASEPPDGIWYCDRILITWQQVPGATAYQVWRSTILDPSTAQQVGTTSDTGYLDYAVSLGTTYYYWAKACNTCGCSAPSGGDSGAIGPPPAAPTGAAASSTFCDRVCVSWNPVPDASGYRLYRNIVDDCTSAQLVYSPPASPWCDFTVTSGVLYYYWVRSETPCGTSACSTPAASGQAGGIAAPTGVSVADGQNCGNMYTSWGSVPGADIYYVYTNCTNDPYTAVLRLGTQNTNAILVRNCNGWEWVWVQACNQFAQCCSPLSLSDRGFAGSPPVPENVAASDGDYCDHIRVTWSNIPSTLAISYDILRDSQIIASGLTSSPFDDFSALLGASHSYSVRAGNSCNPISEATWSPPDTGYRTLVVSAQPTDATVCLGRNHQFCTTAAGQSLGYQWQFNGTDIPGANSPCYVATLSGAYRCVVSSLCGSVTTNAAMLTVVDFDAADVNGDGSVDGRDVQAFSGVQLSAQSGPPDLPLCAADMNGDGLVNGIDAQLFVEKLLGG